MIDHKNLKRPALGRGLGALIPGSSPAERRGVINLGIEEIHPDKNQPRRHFDEAHIAELAESIKSKGLLLPLIVRRAHEGYVLIAGERRWRAAQKAGLRELPAMVREVSEKEAFELALIENIQREDLNPVEEAEAYKRLIDEHGLTQEELAARVGINDYNDKTEEQWLRELTADAVDDFDKFRESGVARFAAPKDAVAFAAQIRDPDGHLVEFTFGQPLAGL